MVPGVVPSMSEPATATGVAPDIRPSGTVAWRYGRPRRRRHRARRVDMSRNPDGTLYGSPSVGGLLVAIMPTTGRSPARDSRMYCRDHAPGGRAVPFRMKRRHRTVFPVSQAAAGVGRSVPDRKAGWKPVDRFPLSRLSPSGEGRAFGIEPFL